MVGAGGREQVDRWLICGMHPEGVEWVTMTVLFAFLADRAEMVNGKMNIVGLFERIIASQFPARHPSMAVIARFEFPSVEYGSTTSLRIALVGPDAKEAMSIEGKMEAGVSPSAPETPPVMHVDQIFQFENLVFPEAGDYAFHIVAEGETKATVPIRLMQASQIP